MDVLPAWGTLTITIALTYRSSVWYLGIVWTIERSRDVEARLAVAEERLRFARDLHDVLGRNLALIAVSSDLAANLLQRSQNGAIDHVEAVHRTAQDSIRELRDVVSGYRTIDLDGELAGARSVLRSAGIEVRVIGDGAKVAAETQAALAWVVREAVTNIIRHSDAGRATISLDVTSPPARTAVLRIEKDGVPALSLPPAPDRAPGAGPPGFAGTPGRCRGDAVRRTGARQPVQGRGLPTDRGRARGRTSGTGTVITVLLADDENLIRSALALLLELEDDLQVVAQAASGEEAIAMARHHRPDVAVLDLQMPGLDGIAVTAVLRNEVPGCASVIVTSHGRPGHLKRALAAGGPGVPAEDRVRARARRRRPDRAPRGAATSIPTWPPRRSAPARAH